jgi:hypothetical protein
LESHGTYSLSLPLSFSNIRAWHSKHTRMALTLSLSLYLTTSTYITRHHHLHHHTMIYFLTYTPSLPSPTISTPIQLPHYSTTCQSLLLPSSPTTLLDAPTTHRLHPTERPMKVEIALDPSQLQSLASRVAAPAPARNGAPAGAARGGRGGRGGGKPRTARPKPKTAEELDAEMSVSIVVIFRG